MKNLFENISEIEKNRILDMHESATKNLYLSEQNSSGDTQEYTNKKIGLLGLLRYRSQIKDIVNRLITTLPANTTEEYKKWIKYNCDDRDPNKNKKIDNFLETRLAGTGTPAPGSQSSTGTYRAVDDFIHGIKNDYKLSTPDEAVFLLANSLDSNILQTLIKTIGFAIDSPALMREATEKIQDYISRKYPKSGPTLNSMITEILGELNAQYYGICDLESASLLAGQR